MLDTGLPPGCSRFQSPVDVLFDELSDSGELGIRAEYAAPDHDDRVASGESVFLSPHFCEHFVGDFSGLLGSDGSHGRASCRLRNSLIAAYPRWPVKSVCIDPTIEGFPGMWYNGFAL